MSAHYFSFLLLVLSSPSVSTTANSFCSCFLLSFLSSTSTLHTPSFPFPLISLLAFPLPFRTPPFRDITYYWHKHNLLQVCSIFPILWYFTLLQVRWYNVPPLHFLMAVQGVPFPLHPQEVGRHPGLGGDVHRATPPVGSCTLHAEGAIPPVNGCVFHHAHKHWKITRIFTYY